MAIEGGQQLPHCRLIEKTGESEVGGEPAYLVPTEQTWHVHYAAWSPVSKKLVYVQDEDYGDIYELVERVEGE